MQKFGVQFYEGTHVNHIGDKSSEYTVLSSDGGFDITAHYVVVATDSPISNRYAIHTKQYAYRTYALAFTVPSYPMEEFLLWDTEDPYHYIRYVDGYLVVGGADHKTGQEPEKDSFKEIEEWTRKKFPFVEEVKWRWSGQVFEPADQMAYIGKAPGNNKNIFIVTGASGIGMTTGTIASLLIPDLIDGKKHPWEKIFDPSRTPLRNLTEYVKENINVAYQYTDWLTPSEVSSAEEIPIDSGSVLREGLSKSCVYHESSDHFEKKSAVCTHLGGIVHWNDIEKTWDCPCHGSRFSSKGKVIEGPALNNLTEN